MRQLIFTLALGTALLASLSLQAQMRGGMGGRGFSGGGHAGSGFHSGGFSGGRGFASGGPRSFSPGPRIGAPGGSRVFVSGPRTFAPRTFAPRTFAPRSFAPRTFGSRNFGVHTFGPSHRFFRPFPGRNAGFRRFHDRFFFRSRFFFPGCFGCVSPFFFSSGFFFGDPFFPGYSAFGPDYYSYAPPPAPPVIVNTDDSGNAQLAAEVERLSDEVDDLRGEQSRGPSEARPASNAPATANEPGMPVSFIFRDGKRISAQNYAITGQTLWILDEHAARKFALADLDKDATQQANAANGIDIHFPVAPAK